jgi:hypothetical protein
VPDAADQNIISPSCFERSPVMVRLFSSMHLIASQRGDGLRPELVRLLEQSRFSALLLESTNVDFRNCAKRPITERNSIAPAANDEGILSVSGPSEE